MNTADRATIYVERLLTATADPTNLAAVCQEIVAAGLLEEVRSLLEHEQQECVARSAELVIRRAARVVK